MKRKFRKILFFSLFFTFVFVAPILVFYFQGYRVDFKNKRITQTGGLFLKAQPKHAEVYINDKLIKKTDFFFGSVLIENLLPKKYNVKLKKQGYFNWEKNLQIKEKEVTEARDIVLFPKNPNFSLLAKGVKALWFSPTGEKIILKEENENHWELKLYDVNKNLKSHILKETDIAKEGADLFDLEFANGEKEIYLKVVIAEQLKEFILDINNIPPLLKEIEKTSTESELKTSTLKESKPKNIIASAENEGNVYYLENTGNLYKTDSSFSFEEKLTESTFPLKQETEYKLYIFSDFIFLKENQTLFLFNKKTKTFEKFFEGIKDIKLSPDFKKLAYFSEYEIKILFLEKRATQPKREKGESIFLIRLSDKIKNVFWITPDYLIFDTENRIKITEIDNRDRLNIIDLTEFSSLCPDCKQEMQKEIFFNSNNKKLYVLAGENLWASKKLLP